MRHLRQRGMIPAHNLAAGRPTADTRPWWNVRNAAGAEADLYIFDEVSLWGVSADQFRRDLDQITAPQINLHISSPGGDVFDGIAIYNMIRQHAAYVVARVDGLAASIASVIVQAGDRRVMVNHSQMMIHDAWGICCGSATDMAEAARMLERQNEVIAGIYLERTRGGAAKLEKIRQAMSAETWMTADEAVTFGLADSVETPKFQSGPADTGDEPADPPPADTVDGPEDNAVDDDATAGDDVWDTLRVELEARTMEDMY